METTRTEPAPIAASEESKRFGTLEEFRRAYFPKDCNADATSSDAEAISRELARRSAILVKSAFASV